jgi:hypothetical protein
LRLFWQAKKFQNLTEKALFFNGKIPAKNKCKLLKRRTKLFISERKEEEQQTKN